MLISKYSKNKIILSLGRKLNKILFPLKLKVIPRPIELVDLDIDLCIDVGANVGQYGSKLFGMGFKGCVLSIEAQPEAQRILEKKANGNKRWIVSEPCAVGDVEKEITFQVAGNSVSSSALEMSDRHVKIAPDSEIEATIKVRQFKLNSIIARTLDLSNFESVYLKLDTQGYEKFILKGISEDLWARINYIELELSLVELYKGQELMSFYVDYLRGRNFSLINIQQELVDEKTGELVQLNGIFKSSSEPN